MMSHGKCSTYGVLGMLTSHKGGVGTRSCEPEKMKIYSHQNKTPNKDTNKISNLRRKLKCKMKRWLFETVLLVQASVLQLINARFLDNAPPLQNVPNVSLACLVQPACQASFLTSYYLEDAHKELEPAMEIPNAIIGYIEEFSKDASDLSKAVGMLIDILTPFELCEFAGEVFQFIVKWLTAMKEPLLVIKKTLNGLYSNVLEPAKKEQGVISKYIPDTAYVLRKVSMLISENITGVMDDLCLNQFAQDALGGFPEKLDAFKSKLLGSYNSFTDDLDVVLYGVKNVTSLIINSTLIKKVHEDIKSVSTEIRVLRSKLDPILEPIRKAMATPLIKVDENFKVHILFWHHTFHVGFSVSAQDFLHFISSWIGKIISWLKHIFHSIVSWLENLVNKAVDFFMAPILQKLKGLGIAPLAIIDTAEAKVSKVLNPLKGLGDKLISLTGPALQEINALKTGAAQLVNSLAKDMHVAEECFQGGKTLKCMNKFLPGLPEDLPMPLNVNKFMEVVGKLDLAKLVSGLILGCSKPVDTPICTLFKEGSCTSKLTIPTCEKLDIADEKSERAKPFHAAMASLASELGSDNSTSGRRLGDEFDFNELGWCVILYPNIPKTGHSKFDWFVWPKTLVEKYIYMKEGEGGGEEGRRFKFEVFSMQVRLLVCLTGGKLDSVTIRPRLKWVKVSYKKHFGAPTVGDVGIVPDGEEDADVVGDDLLQVPVQGGPNQPIAQLPQRQRAIVQDMFDADGKEEDEGGHEEDAPRTVVRWGWSSCKAARDAFTSPKVAAGMVAAGCCYLAFCAFPGGRRLVEFPDDTLGSHDRQLAITDNIKDYIKGFDSTVEFSFTLLNKLNVEWDFKGWNPWENKYLKYSIPNRNGLTMYANNGLFEAGVQFRQSDEKGQFGVVYFSIMTKLLSIKKWASIRSTTPWDFITNNFDKDNQGRRGYTINAFLWSEWSKFQIDG
mmetsp:Transcript_3935/g.8676  ORF Transcript_3935/g.8676 Transcript_3935/m.8676 type:complete len:952 (-) Transcript_3935:1933-4788(-)